jgi:uncharacterized membrane-anchored protein
MEKNEFHNLLEIFNIIVMSYVNFFKKIVQYMTRGITEEVLGLLFFIGAMFVLVFKPLVFFLILLGTLVWILYRRKKN